MYGEVCGTSKLELAQPIKILDRLRARKAEHQRILEQIDMSISYLEKNPDLENFMSCIRDVGCL